MKLLIYSHFFPPSIGGVETIVRSLARGLAGLRDLNGLSEFEVTLVTQTPPGNYDDSTFPFRVVRQPALPQLWRLIRACDVVHVAGPALAPLILSMVARKPLVVEHHGYQAICPNGLLFYQPTQTICPGHFQSHRYNKCLGCNMSNSSFWTSSRLLLFTFIRRALCRRVTSNIAISNHVAKRHLLPRSTVIYHGIEDPLRKDFVSPAAVNTSGGVCFAYVGRLVLEKGIPILLQAAQTLKREGHHFEVRLIGDGPQRPKLEAIIGREHLENCVRITGYLTGPALTDALRDVRVVVMPSVWEETAGLAAIEQMMRGRLVIASKIGGLAEVVDDAGMTFPAGDVQALAECMQKVLQDPSIIESFGRTARDRALHFFRRELMIGDHARVYRGLLQNRRQ